MIKHPAFMRLTTTLQTVALLTGCLVSGRVNGQIFVGSWGGARYVVGKYTMSGATLNASLLLPGDMPYGLALDASGHLYVAGYGQPGRVGVYNLDGTAINASLISTYTTAFGIALDGQGHIFVSDYDRGIIGKYNLDGTTVNASLISGLHGPGYMAIDGSGHLYVGNYEGTNGIGKYNLDGTTVNASLIPLTGPAGIALDGIGHLFVAHGSVVGEYNLDGTTVNASLIQNGGQGIALDGNGHIFIACPGWYAGTGLIAEYNLDGTPVNPSLISGLTQPLGIAVVPLSAAPSVTSQPQSVTDHAHDNASFNVIASGYIPMIFQWAFNGTNILGATSSSLTISNVTQHDLGDYSVTVTNGFGSTTSSNAVLSMYPFLTLPFRGAMTYWGKPTTFSIQVWGTAPLSYQWFKDGVPVQSATNASLSFANMQTTNAGLYSVIVSNPLGSVTNAPAQVIVIPAGVSLGFSPTLTLSGVIGYSYIIQSTTDLTNTNSWVTLTNLTLTQPVQLWVDTSVDATSPFNSRYFYRVLPGQ